MQKQAPSFGRILVAVGFALSCFGLILFLWVAFGGPVPLKPESYRITAYFPEATQLAQQSDVRIGGVSVGKVQSIKLAPPDQRVNGQDTTEAEIEIEPQYAPISTDARAILRQKTLLGETYVELTSGTNPNGAPKPVSLGSAASTANEGTSTEGVKSIPEGGTLAISQTQDATQIDEIFNALDKQTRVAFQRWIQNSAVAIKGRGLDLNDAFGNLGPFATDASRILQVLHRQQNSVRGLVRDTGTVFDAISAGDGELSRAITGSDTTFKALASENQALHEAFQIFPTFEHESALTLARLDRFRANAHPLVEKLLPVANDISPTLKSVRQLSPHLRSLFIDLKPLIKVSRKGLPATARFIAGVRPVLGALDPFLSNLNPVISYLGAFKTEITNFLTGPPTGFSTLDPTSGQPAARFSLRVLSYFDAQSLSIYPTRLATNRGNGYVRPNALISQGTPKNGIFANWDCKNTNFGPTGPPGGVVTENPILPGQSVPGVNNGNPPDVSVAPCFIQTPFAGSTTKFPRLFAEP
jgi:phospholipid/cholesterol/gamma-HCH transport system substrate-binding protein